ncbi:MAG: hypothetical protein A2017_17175 [Lentisphaerae bacterium GWF2_44_16]|nr:MAG: hypothetical protein A2017_17175 [Lentisphaerae bacterium GWF2_44_16]
MSDLFNIGVTGMDAQSNALSVIGNNIANSTTCAYKSNSINFAEVLVTHEGQYSNGLWVQYGNGVQTLGVTTDWSSGSVVATGEQSNIAISGDGFLPVSYADSTQVYYTRAGDFSLVEYDLAGVTVYTLMRTDGSMLLGGTALDAVTNTVTGMTASTFMYFDAAPTSYTISADGTVTAIGANVVNGYVGVQRFTNPDSLKRIEGGIYEVTSSTAFTTADPSIPGYNDSGTLLQGNLEASNTDLVSEFSSLIQAQRAFQGCSKVITVADEVLQTILSLKR